MGSGDRCRIRSSCRCCGWWWRGSKGDLEHPRDELRLTPERRRHQDLKAVLARARIARRIRRPQNLERGIRESSRRRNRPALSPRFSVRPLLFCHERQERDEATPLRRAPRCGAPSEAPPRACRPRSPEYVREIVRVGVSDDDWIDQHASPLGKRAHLEAVRRGDLRGTKHGRRVLVRRSELDSFLESHPASHRKSEIERSDGVVDQARATEVAAKILADMGLRLRSG